MAEPTQFSFELRELTEALIKQQGITEGVWMLGFEFNLIAANIGPSATDIKPSAILQIAKASLVRQNEGGEKFPFVVDAAQVAKKET